MIWILNLQDFPSRPVRKLVKIDYETSKVWFELCGRLIGYVCVWEGGRGEKHLSRVEYRVVSQRVTIFYSYIISNCSNKTIRHSFFMCVCCWTQVFSASNQECIFCWGGGGGWDVRMRTLVPRHFSVLLLEPIDAGILVNWPLLTTFSKLKRVLIMWLRSFFEMNFDWYSILIILLLNFQAL